MNQAVMTFNRSGLLVALKVETRTADICAKRLPARKSVAMTDTTNVKAAGKSCDLAICPFFLASRSFFGVAFSVFSDITNSLLTCPFLEHGILSLFCPILSIFLKRERCQVNIL